MPLFEVAVLEMPTKQASDEGALEKLVLAPTTLIAKDSQSAAMKAVMGISKDTPCDMERLDVRVRPF